MKSPALQEFPVRKLGSRPQRTLGRTVEIRGVGFVTGTDVRVRFRPAPPHSGLLFVRTDLPGKPAIPASADAATANRRTTLGYPPAQVELVEHVLAALHGLRIDNCTIEINGPELPGLDGSAAGFTELLCDAGTTAQRARRDIWTVEEPITVSSGSATLTIHPTGNLDLRISYLLDYGPRSPIPRQRHTLDVTPVNFLNCIAASRTFLLQDEAEQFRKMGWGSRIKESDLLIFGPHGPLGNELRYDDEPARHKVLDVVGDLALVGHSLCGHVVAYRSGHALNVALGRKLVQEIARQQPVVQLSAA
jgi:UDP-3-O-[3-hydroxymyristoyl] N-acetylglucosamine deacetylase